MKLEPTSAAKVAWIPRLMLIGFVLLSARTLQDLWVYLQANDLLFSSLRWTALLAAVILSLASSAALLGLSWLPPLAVLDKAANKAQNFLMQRKALNLLASTACFLLFPALVMGFSAEFFLNMYARVWAFLVCASAAAAFLAAFRPGYTGGYVLALALTLQAVIYQVAAFLPSVSSHPFSLGWSEGSRYYYASLLFSEKLYGMRLPPSVWHPSRYILQSIPFLINHLPLWFHRLWQVLLWLGLTTFTSIALAHRIRAAAPMNERLLLAGWAFLFLFQGPVYYHLQVCVLIILWGVSPKKLTRSLAAVVLASLWAGISRINWAPIPAMLAAAIYILEQPFEKSFWDYFKTPLSWGAAGFAAALASQAAYAALSGNDLSQFGSSFTSDLLWYRLLPNATFPPGILPGIAIASLPVWTASALKSYRVRRSWHPLRWAALAGALAAAFGMGLVVSTKIGGGGDLHNMDAYLVLLMVIGASLCFDRFTPDQVPVAQPRLAWLAIALALAVPVGFRLQTGGPVPRYDQAEVERILTNLQSIANEAVARNQEILFISQRQLLIFGYLQGIPLVPEYENITLMEMAMSKNQAYLARFYKDLLDHRFSIIISHRNPIYLKDRTTSLPEENNAWVEMISIPLYRSYETQRIFKSEGIEVLVPRQDSSP